VFNNCSIILLNTTNIHICLAAIMIILPYNPLHSIATFKISDKANPF